MPGLPRKEQTLLGVFRIQPESQRFVLGMLKRDRRFSTMLEVRVEQGYLIESESIFEFEPWQKPGHVRLMDAEIVF